MIRHAHAEDAKRIIEIYTPYVEKTAISFAYETPSAAEIEDKRRSSVGRHIYLVLEMEGKIVGVCLQLQLQREKSL